MRNQAGGSSVVLGVGNRLRGDDAIGCIVCDEIRNSPPRHKDTKLVSESDGPTGGLVDSSHGESFFVLDCGSTPENYIQPIVDRKPDRVLVVDCCDFGAEPGEFRLFCRSDIEQLSYGLMSTHTLPLALTIDMLFLQTNATIELLGIQPQQMEFGQNLSEPIRRALPAVVEFARNWAGKPQPGA